MGAPAGFKILSCEGVEQGRWWTASCVLYKLPGHKGTVTSVDFHPKEPIILTGSKDGTMLLGEINQYIP
ncbi:hypothetical protein A0H81_09771 [Grifola frondosa]|uniref:Uncharacterized protein n=1 Tax=Grifola frondosa TaxID=5627 RepID=A0A1C7M013_GRIFR|nr:hypothetical protein A0H81_09771 [Grifola frondosa]